MARGKPIKTSASQKKRGTPLEAPVSPLAEQIQIPAGLTLQRRPVCSPRADERPTLRTADGRVLAVVEQWRPDALN